MTYDYYYNTGWQILEVRRNADTDPYKQYVWDLRYIDAPVLRWRDGNTDGDLDDEGDDTLYYTNDANMNVTALVRRGDGTVLERYAYDPYGEVTVLNGADGVDPDTTAGGDDEEWTTDADGVSDVANEVLFCGYRFDPETALNHVRYRMYHPTLGRWLQRDPIGYADGMGLNEYGQSVPASRIDPSGLRAWAGHLSVEGGIVKSRETGTSALGDDIPRPITLVWDALELPPLGPPVRLDTLSWREIRINLRAEVPKSECSTNLPSPSVSVSEGLLAPYTHWTGRKMLFGKYSRVDVRYGAVLKGRLEKQVRFGILEAEYRVLGLSDSHMLEWGADLKRALLDKGIGQAKNLGSDCCYQVRGMGVEDIALYVDGGQIAFDTLSAYAAAKAMGVILVPLLRDIWASSSGPPPVPVPVR
ncbi:MAG: RHS repeat-associated core domain-containing protein [Phycisphaerae bacterium]